MYKIVKHHIKAADGTKKWYQNRDDFVANVTHVDLGTLQSTLDTLEGAKSASYHLYIPRENDNEIWELVPFEGGAWHAGKKANPTQRAQQIIGNQDANKNTFSICYGGRAVNKHGQIARNWKEAVDGQKPIDSQVARAAWALEYYGTVDLPLLSHKEITSYKPASVLEFNELIRAMLNGDMCRLSQFTTKQLFDELFKRVAAMRKK
jgi:hypothetical protein